MSDSKNLKSTDTKSGADEVSSARIKEEMARRREDIQQLKITSPTAAERRRTPFSV